MSIARSNEPVTMGVPLPDAYPDTSSLGISGATVGQFRVLSRYPSGNVHWVLVDTQASLAAGGTTALTLTNGSGNFGGTNLATDNGATITVDTGAAQFRVRKANFNVFDNVVVGGITLVSAQTGECALYDQTGAKFSSLNDAASTAVLEENGPARCCIKASGMFKNASGTRLAEYTLRMHFYKGKSFVRATYTLRNDDNQYIGPVYFSAMEATVPLAITNPTATLATKIGSVSGALTGTQRATLMQAFSLFAQGSNGSITGVRGLDTYTPPLPIANGDFALKGLEIVIAGVTQNAFGTSETDWTQGWGDLSNASGVGCTTVVRWMGSYWPAGFDFGADGRLSIETFSKRNPKTDNKLMMLRHDWRDILWDFHVSPNDKNLSLHRCQAPLVMRAGQQHYAATGAIFGQTEIPSLQEESDVFAATGHADGWDTTAMLAASPYYVYRAWAWGQGSGNNQIDDPLDEAIGFLRGANVGHLHAGWARTFFNYTQGTKIIPGQELISFNATTEPWPASSGTSNIVGDGFQSEHYHMMSLFLFYFLTGDMGYSEAIEGISRMNYNQQIIAGFTWADNINWYAHRAWSRLYRNSALIYEFGLQTGNFTVDGPHLLPTIKLATDQFLDRIESFVDANGVPINHPYSPDPQFANTAPYDPTNWDWWNVTPGRNLQRGYLYFDWDITHSSSGSHGYRMCHALFGPQIFFEAAWQVLRVYRKWVGGYRDDEQEDFLHGLSRFYFGELYDDTTFSPNDGVNDVGFIYDNAIYDWAYPTTLAAPLTGGFAIDARYGQYKAGGNPYDPSVDAYIAANPIPQSGYLWPYDASRAAVQAYKWTGDSTYLQKAKRLMWRVREFANGLNPWEMQGQALIDASYRAPKAWANLPLTVTPSGSNYILSWTAPAGATRVRIKTHTKNIVDWLGFNRYTRTFANPPATNVPWFAATSVANVPAPSVGTMTVSGLPGGSQFSARVI